MNRYILLLIINIVLSYSFSFLHITDIHVDMKYHAGSASKCSEFSKLGTLCCRILDIPINGSHSCSKWGDLNNDVPPLLFSSIINWTKNNLNFDFIINTGDSGSHKDIDQVFSSDNEKSINFVSDVVDNIFPNKPQYNVIGNHDSYWNVDQTFPGYSGFLKRTTKLWQKWVNDTNMIDYGYYSVDLNKYVKIISFNSLYYDTNNFFQVNSTKKDIKYTNNQINWLKNIFEICKKNNQKVIFLNHIPLYGSESNSYMNDNLSKILYSYNETILLNLNGHSHKDRILLYKINNTFTNYALINPSIYTDNDFPSFRIYTYENNILNYENYYCNLTRIIETDTFLCEKNYNFLKEYDLENIDLNNIINLYNKINSSNKTYYYKYVKNYSPPNFDLKYNYISEIINSN